MKGDFSISRREAARLIGGAAAATFCPITLSAEEKSAAAQLSRAIPSTGERISAIGLGTSGTFDVGASPNERSPLREVLRRFAQLGGQVIDTSPMYGPAESVVGDLTS